MPGFYASLLLLLPLAGGAAAPPESASAAAPRALPPAASFSEPAPNLGVPLLHTAALFLGMRVTEAVLWPEPFAETKPKVWLAHYERAYTEPPVFDENSRAFEWDHDRFALNIVGHGLLGAELYYRPRRCGLSPLPAFVFAAGASTTWEYLVEANGVRPSALDLVYTPIAGIALGELRHWGVTWSRALHDPFLRGFVQTVLDPFGEIERALGAPC